MTMKYNLINKTHFPKSNCRDSTLCHNNWMVDIQGKYIYRNKVMYGRQQWHHKIV